MRGRATKQTDLLTLINVEGRIPSKHPIRRIKAMVDEVLVGMDDCFEEMYEREGRASIPPERLLKAKVLMALYTVRSERQFCERLNYDLLFQWFLDMNPSESAFHPTVFTKNMDRLLEHQTSELYFSEVVELARRHDWVSSEHFSVDGTLIEAWASMKSFRPKDDDGEDSNGWQNYKGKKRSNEIHESRTDPEARLLRKGVGKEAKLCFAAHAAMENRNGLCVLMDVTASVGVTEPEQALQQMDELCDRGFDPSSVGGDSGYHTKDFVKGCRDRGIKPHVAAHAGRKTPGLDGRTRRSGAYQASQKVRKRVEEIFGWSKTTGVAFRKSRYKGYTRTGICAQFVAATCNLVRMAKLMEESPPQYLGA